MIGIARHDGALREPEAAARILVWQTDAYNCKSGHAFGRLAERPIAHSSAVVVIAE